VVVSKHFLIFTLGFFFIGNLSFALQTLTLGNGAEPKDLDPQTEVGVPEAHIIWNLFEGLVGKDPKTLANIPSVAESWKESADGKEYVFKLRKDAKWSNGEPLTAEDFVYAWRRLVSPALASVYAYEGFYLKNGKEINSGKIKDLSQLGVKATDPYTLQVTLESPVPFFLELLFHQSYYPIPKKTVEKFGNRWTRAENMVSNGAFILKSWEINRKVTLVKNPYFWDKAKVALDEVNFLPVQNASTEQNMFLTHQLDITNTIPTEMATRWANDKTGVLYRHPYLSTYAYKVNVTKPPLNNKLVRQALALGFNREKIVKYVLKMGQIPSPAYNPPGIGGYTPHTLLPKGDEGVAKAKALLAQAGYPNGKGLPPIDILYNTDEGHKKIGEAVQEMWKQNLGVNVRLYNQEWKVLLDNDRNKNYQLVRFSWTADYNDPNTFLELFQTKGGNNNTGWSNKNYDALLESAGKERNQTKRFDYFSRAEDILMDELPIIPIYIYVRNYLVSTKVKGWEPNVLDIHQLRYVSLASGNQEKK
jgi:oligopeptide transport system substrate-binding protein